MELDEINYYHRGFKLEYETPEDFFEYCRNTMNQPVNGHNILISLENFKRDLLDNLKLRNNAECNCLSVLQVEHLLNELLIIILKTSIPSKNK